MARTKTTATTERIPVNVQHRVLQLIEAEAALAGQDRNEFIRMLIRRGMGAIRADRGPAAPPRSPLKASKTKLKVVRFDLWVQPEHREWLRTMRITSGGVPYSAIVTLLALEWAGINPLHALAGPQ